MSTVALEGLASGSTVAKEGLASVVVECSVVVVEYSVLGGWVNKVGVEVEVEEEGKIVVVVDVEVPTVVEVLLSSPWCRTFMSKLCPTISFAQSQSTRIWRAPAVIAS